MIKLWSQDEHHSTIWNIICDDFKSIKSEQAQKMLFIDALDFGSLEQLDQMSHSDNPH